MISEHLITKLWWDSQDDTSDRREHQVFARSIEAEVRKSDEALILQLVEALEVATTPLAKDRQEVLAAITAARARLEGKP